MRTLSAPPHIWLPRADLSGGKPQNRPKSARADISYSQVKSNNCGQVRILRPRAVVDTLSRL
jgi:hypothetical protein